MTIHWPGDPSREEHRHDFGDNGVNPTGTTTTGAIGQCSCGLWGEKVEVDTYRGTGRAWKWKPISPWSARRKLRKAGVPLP